MRGPRRFVSRMCAARRYEHKACCVGRCVTFALCPPDRCHAAPVHRGPVPAEDAARAARPPPAGPAAVRGRAAHGRYPVGRRQHPVRRLRAAHRPHRRAAGATGPGLRPAAAAASAAGTCRGRDVPAAQDHQNVDDGTTGQRTPPMLALDEHRPHRSPAIRPRPTASTDTHRPGLFRPVFVVCLPHPYPYSHLHVHPSPH